MSERFLRNHRVRSKLFIYFAPPLVFDVDHSRFVYSFNPVILWNQASSFEGSQVVAYSMAGSNITIKDSESC